MLYCQCPLCLGSESDVSCGKSSVELSGAEKLLVSLEIGHTWDLDPSGSQIKLESFGFL
jgi:hypothetical protein